jgi:deoxyribodipyrimidine photo-lyase
VKGKAIQAPWDRLDKKEQAKLAKLGYPKPIVEHKFARDRALSRYKAGLSRNTT